MTLIREHLLSQAERQVFFADYADETDYPCHMTTSENMRREAFLLKVYYSIKTQDGDVTQSNIAFLQLSGTFLQNGIKTTACGSMGHFSSFACDQ